VVGQQLHWNHSQDSLQRINNGWDLDQLAGINFGGDVFVSFLADDDGFSTTSNHLNEENIQFKSIFKKSTVNSQLSYIFGQQQMRG